MRGRAWAWAGLLLGVLAGCGGGGGGGGDNTTQAQNAPSATLLTPSLSFTAVADSGVTASSENITVRVDGVSEGESLWFAVEGGSSLISDAVAAPEFSTEEQVALTLRDDLAAGSYTDSVKLHICSDNQCAHEIQGSPMTVALQAVVKPNIAVQSLVELSRTGAEAAPQASVVATIPPEAGAVYLSLTETSPAIALDLSGNTLTATTQQFQAGTYEVAGQLLSPVDARYHASFTVRYTVNPPAGGEHGMSITPSGALMSLSQGEVKTLDLAVTRPTWTDAYTPLAPGSDCDPMFSLADLGGGNFRLTANATGLAVGILHSCTLYTQAGNTGASVTINALVAAAFSVGGNYGFTIGRATTADQLTNTMPVQMTDGSAVTWTATTDTPWLHLAHTTGTTGVDPIVATLDTNNLAQWLPGASGHVVVSVARADVPSQDIGVPLGFNGPYLTDVWPGTLQGSSGRVYVSGYFNYGDESNGTLQVSGARVLHQQLVTDSFYLGGLPVVQVDVDQAVAGQPIAISVASPYLATQGSAAVAAAPTWSAGFAALPYGLRKPPSFSPGNAALYLAGGDTLWRFAAQGGAWTLGSVSAPGVIDVDPRPDEAHVLTVTASAVQMRDATTLAPAWDVPLQEYFGTAGTIASAQDPDTKAVLHTSDGYAWTTDAYAANTGVGNLMLDAWDTMAPAAARFNDSRGFYGDSGLAPWMIGSAGRKSVLAASGLGTRGTWMLGETMTRVGTTGISYAVHPAAVSDAGDRLVFANGTVMSGLGTMSAWDLSGLLPAGQQAGGWGLTGDGHWLLLYTYQLQGSGDAATATQPVLHVFDLAGVVFGGAQLPSETAALALSGVPGCGSPRAGGETCAHTAHVTVDPQATLAFVTGPRGVAAVPLPAAMKAASSTRGMRRATAVRTAAPSRAKVVTH